MILDIYIQNLPNITNFFTSCIPSISYFLSLKIYKIFHRNLKDNKYNQIFNSNKNIASTFLVNSLLVYPIYSFFGFEIEEFRSFQIVLGILIVDTVEYFYHRFYHKIPFLYKHLHSAHHNIYLSPDVSFTNNEIEPLVTSTSVFLSLLCFLSFFEYIIVSSLSFIATIADHTNTRKNKFHYIHHHVNKNTNFQQPFFTFWDHIFGTYNPKSSLKIPFIP
tara:strand:- start:353 stop:1009 length:657 start_codon:yes stop_codon:yes gene_type:complete